jgi:hypothetical protein
VTDLLRIHPEVRAALESRRPVVALETTLVAHGFRAESEPRSLLRRSGACAWPGRYRRQSASSDGRICVGLEAGELERFATSPEARKVGHETSPPARWPRSWAPPQWAQLSPSVARRASGSWAPAGSAESPRLGAFAGHLRRPQRARSHGGARRRVGREVDPRRGRDGRGTGDTWRAPARVAHDEMPLFYKADGGPPVSSEYRASRRPPR